MEQLTSNCLISLKWKILIENSCHRNDISIILIIIVLYFEMSVDHKEFTNPLVLNFLVEFDNRHFKSKKTCAQFLWCIITFKYQDTFMPNKTDLCALYLCLSPTLAVAVLLFIFFFIPTHMFLNFNMNSRAYYLRIRDMCISRTFPIHPWMKLYSRSMRISLSPQTKISKYSFS